MPQVALFAGLITDETDRPVEVTRIGDVPHYVIDDAGFHRHIPTEKVDRQVLALLQEQVEAHREEAVAGTLQMLGQDDLFTKAMVEASINRMDENVDNLLQVGFPDEVRAGLGMMGFHVVIDVHGDVIEIKLPGMTGAPDPEEEDL